MKLNRYFSTAVICFALALGTAACKKDEGGGGSSDGSSAAAMAKSSFQVFPKETQLVFGLSFSSLKKSSLWKKYEPQIRKKLESEDEFKMIKDDCGIDPFNSFTTMLIGGNIDDEDMTIVVKGLKRTDLESCAEKIAKKKGEDIKLTQEGKITKIEADGDTMFIGWLDDSTMITGPKAEDNKSWVEERMAGKNGMAKDSAMMGLLGKVDSGATMWATFIPSDKMKGDMPIPAQAGHASITATSGFKLNAAVTFADEAAAKGLVDQATSMMGMAKADPQAGKFVEKVKLAANGKDMTVKLELSEAELTELSAMVEKQLPGLMMMMGGM